MFLEFQILFKEFLTQQIPGIDMAYEDFPHKHQDDPV